MSNNIAQTVLTDLKQFTYDNALQSQASEQVAAACAKAAIKCIRLNFKNRLMYIPSVCSADKAKEYEEIRKAFTGSNHAELAIKYKRSLQNIYSILKTRKPAKPKRAIAIVVMEDYLPVEFVRSGLSKTEAETLAKDIARHMQQTFPGIGFSIGRISS